MDKRIKLTGVWKKEMDDGTVYWKGKINDFLHLCIFERTKENDNAPDLDVVLIQKGGK